MQEEEEITLRRLLLFGVAAIAGALVLMMVARGANAQDGAPPSPSAGTMLVDGLLQPRGTVVGPDGLIYIAEAGSGGDTEFVTDDGVTLHNGFTGRISAVDPDTGERTTVAGELPSSATEEGEAIGPADVAFLGDQLYLLLTHGGEAWGFPDTPTGIYEVNDDGSIDLVADIYEFNVDNPVEAVTSGAQQDVEVGGNPYSMMTRGGNFYVVDGNHNRLMEITPDGDITEVVEFPDHPVSTGIDAGSTGPFYVAYLGQGPFLPEAGKVVQVSTTGTITEVASGVPMLTDVEIGPSNVVYALSFADGFAPGTGSIVKVAGTSFTPVVAGLTFATSMEFIGDTAYVLNDGINALGTGQLWEIENISTQQPPATPTAAASPTAPAATPTRTGVTAPDTGTGPGEGGTDVTVLLLALGLAATALVAGGGALALKRR